MFASPFKPRAVVRRLTALAIALWLAGAGCLLGCEIVAAAAGHDASTHSAATLETASAASCPMHSGGGDCCHKAKRRNVQHDAETAQTLTPTTQTPAPSRNIPDVSCCPLANRAADPARKIRLSDAPRVVENRALPRAQNKAEHLVELYAPKTEVRDRGSTHLRFCVFLI